MDLLYKDIPGYEGLYAVTNDGRVWSYRRQIWRKLAPSRSGYPATQLWDGSRTHLFIIHRLVAQMFIPNPANKRCVNHKNGNKADNRIGNLEWVTHSENTRHAIRTGLLTIRKGIRVAQAKFTEQQIIDMRQHYAKGLITQAQLARDFNVDTSTINCIIKRKTWRHI